MMIHDVSSKMMMTLSNNCLISNQIYGKGSRGENSKAWPKFSRGTRCQ